MSKKIIISFFLLPLFLLMQGVDLYGGGSGVTLTFRAGRALEDYEEDKESIYYRSTAEISSQNLMTIRAMRQQGAKEEGAFHSYGFWAKTPQGALQLFGGDFSLAPGGGLILGRKMHMPSDPFTGSIGHSSKGVIRLGGNSNPTYNFHGLALKAQSLNRTFPMSITAFLSKRKRFPTGQSNEGRAVQASLNTVLTKIYPAKEYIDPMFINDMGIILSAGMKRSINLNLFAFRTSMTNWEDEAVMWNAKGDPPSGKREVRNGGAFLSYRSTSLSGYVEFGITSFRTEKWKYGKGVKTELIFKHGKTRLSLLGKNTDLNFNSPYSSGERGPMRGMEMALAFPLHRLITPGMKVTTIQDLKPDSRDREYYRKTIEELHLRMGSSRGFRGKIKFKKLIPQDEEPSYRMGAELFSPKGGKLYGELKFMAQQMEDIRSYGVGSHMVLNLTKSLSLQGGAALIMGKKSSPLYWTSKPPEKGAMPGGLYKEKTGVYIVKASYRNKKNKAELRYQENRRSGSTERRLSFAGVLFFQF